MVGLTHSPATITGVLLAWALAACATLPQAPGPARPRAMVEDGAVRSVFFPEPASTCRAAPCPGRVPPEYVAGFRHALEAAGFEVVDKRGRAAPVARISVDHLATTPTECDMSGVVYVADNAIEVKRSYLWQRGAYATAFGAARDKALTPELEQHVLRTCLAAFARSARDSLATDVGSGR